MWGHNYVCPISHALEEARETDARAPQALIRDKSGGLDFDRHLAGTLAAYINHNYYGIHKSSAVRRQKGLSLNCRYRLPIDRILFCRFSFFDCRLHPVQSTNGANSAGLSFIE
jgi:hypothetical protein